jgi:hypothetical protein
MNKEYKMRLMDTDLDHRIIKGRMQRLIKDIALMNALTVG